MSIENKPPRPISSDDVPWTEVTDIPGFEFRFKHLTAAAFGDKYHVGVAIEELAPGMRTNPSHYHFLEEEHVYVLAGEVTAHTGGKAFPMKAGDYVCWPAGQRAGHYLKNEGTERCRYVILGENRPDDVVIYPDSNKVMVRSLGRRAIFDMAALRNYWDGESVEQPSVPSEHSRGKLEVDPQEPLPPISAESIGWNEEGREGSAMFGGRSRHLTHAAAGENYHVGVLIEQPAPGKRLCPKHYHMLEEEHALILEGQLTLLFGDERIEMRPGDYVCFPAGQKIGHSFMNSGDGPCSYLMIGERKQADVCVYTDSNKVMVRALQSERDIFDMAAARGYWDGEE
jgi:uncharacterized cupin superfamily protein